LPMMYTAALGLGWAKAVAQRTLSAMVPLISVLTNDFIEKDPFLLVICSVTVS